MSTFPGYAIGVEQVEESTARRSLEKRDEREAKLLSPSSTLV